MQSKAVPDNAFSCAYPGYGSSLHDTQLTDAEQDGRERTRLGTKKDFMEGNAAVVFYGGSSDNNMLKMFAVVPAE